jgi:hypothetical protein
MKPSLMPKLVEKLAWVPFILFCKVSFTVSYAFDARIMPNGGSCPSIA